MPNPEAFKSRHIAFIHKMILIMEHYSVDEQHCNILYKVSGDKLITGEEMTWASPDLENFTMQASEEYLVIVGGDYGMQVSDRVDVSHIMDLGTLTNKPKQGLRLQVPRSRPSVTFNLKVGHELIVVGGWTDPNSRHFANSAEFIDIKSS